MGKITDFRKTNKIEGVGLYLIKDLNPFNCYLKDRQKFVRLNELMNMYNSNNVYTSAELKFLDTMGWKYKIVAGCWGVKTLDFEFGENMLSKMGKKPFVDEKGNLKMKGSSFYAVATGAWASHSTHEYKYIQGTKETAEMLRQQLGEAVLTNPDIDDEICIRTRKTSINTLTHVSAFILAYQRLSLIEQLMEMDIDKLQSIYVDGIYYIDHEFKVLDTFQEGNCESYSSMNIKNKDFIKGQSGVVAGHAYHLYVIEVEDRLGLYNYLRENHVYAQIHYIPCHLMPYYRDLGWREGDRLNAENYYRHCISLPMYPTLSGEEQMSVIKLIDSYYV